VEDARRIDSELLEGVGGRLTSQWGACVWEQGVVLPAVLRDRGGRAQRGVTALQIEAGYILGSADGPDIPEG